MHVFPQFERYVWLDRELAAGHFPNARQLADKFEISTKTAQRDFIRLRDRLLAPLDYDRQRRGYYYTEPGFELPFIRATQEEMLAVLIARRLLAHTAGGFISREIDQLKKKLNAALSGLGLDEQTVDLRFSAAWNGYAPSQSEVFRQVAFALIQNRRITFRYRSPATDLKTEREVEPYHLQHYMGSWALLGWCRLRRDWRKFLLARMRDLRVLAAEFAPLPAGDWQGRVDDAFGIFQGETLQEVRLRFVPRRARWIIEQRWHPRQRMVWRLDGRLDLILPVADFREIKLKVLQFGADVEVVAPEGLRREVAAEILRMGRVYGVKSGKNRKK